MELDLIKGGTFQIDSKDDVCECFIDDKTGGIMLNLENGLRLTIKNTEKNRKLWNIENKK